jgi:tetratricopeptide (TPR) repeat protein
MGRRLFFADWLDAFAIEADARAGRLDEAIAAAEHAVPTLRAVGSSFAEAIAQQAWGLALTASGRLDEARTHLAEAVRLLDAGDAHMEAARARAVLDLVDRRTSAGARA